MARYWRAVSNVIDPVEPDVIPYISYRIRALRQVAGTERNDALLFAGERMFVPPYQVGTIVIVHHRISVVLDFPKVGVPIRQVYFEKDDFQYTQIEVTMPVFVREFEIEV